MSSRVSRAAARPRCPPIVASSVPWRGVAGVRAARRSLLARGTGNAVSDGSERGTGNAVFIRACGQEVLKGRCLASHFRARNTGVSRQQARKKYQRASLRRAAGDRASSAGVGMASGTE